MLLVRQVVFLTSGGMLLLALGLLLYHNTHIGHHMSYESMAGLLRHAAYTKQDTWALAKVQRDVMSRIRDNKTAAVKLPNDAVKEFKLLAVRREVVCTDWKMYGASADGFWPVCRASGMIPKQPCTVYSFGINYDWAFDDAYRATHKCIIRTFDPSMGKTEEHEHIKGVPFYPLGISDRQETNAKGWKLKSFKDFLIQFHEENIIIPYLKIDVEEYEWRVLANMLSDGVLQNVKQLSFEMHVSSWKSVLEYTDFLRGLYALGFRRWYHRLHPENRKGDTFIYQCDQSYININFLDNIQ